MTMDIIATLNAYELNGKEHDEPSSTGTDERGYTFNQLLDKLLAQPLSKADTKFSTIFLALYRFFASPFRLLDAIIGRFKELDKNGKPMMIRIIAQLRYLGILEQWLRSYPGDFAFPSTRQYIVNFVGYLETERIFAVAAREIQMALQNIRGDDDTDWAYCDKNCPSALHALKSPSNANMADTSFLRVESPDEDRPVLAKCANSPNRSDNFEVNTSEVASGLSNTGLIQAQWSSLVSSERVYLSKIQWHMLNDQPEDRKSVV